MATRRKSEGGCWTCRLRRKKCDEGKPRCGNCTVLEIRCHGGTIRPAWMDGSTKQEEATKMIKAQIKHRGEIRRERQTGDRNFIVESVQDFIDKSSRIRRPQIHTVDNKPTGSSSDPGTGTTEDPNQLNENKRTPSLLTPEAALVLDAASSREDDRMQSASSALSFLDEYEEVHDHLPMLSRGRDFEVDFLMKYLDYVFPVLFPFYRPGIHETGRSWVLALLRRSRVAFHSAVSLSSYFFISTLIEQYPRQHRLCKMQLWEKVGRQTDICFEMIQHDIQDLGLRSSQATLVEKARVMESIVQLLIFEVALSRSADWNLHLTPALALFEEIWQSATTTEGPEHSQMLAVLDAVTPHLQFDSAYSGYVWSPEQAGLRFFTGLLAFIDIIASTSLEQPPRLAQYHEHLLAQTDYGGSDFGRISVQLSTIVGCQNFVQLAISRTAALAAWKRVKKQAGTFPLTELVHRADYIYMTLHDEMCRLEMPASDPGENTSLNFRSYSNDHPSTSSRSSMIPTRIWAHAAHIYLAVVRYGWQWRPSALYIRGHVTQILELVRTIDCSAHLRTLAWPLCVAGCLAEAGSHERAFRTLFAGMDELSMVGALGEASKIMDKVWEKRETLDPETWDLAACFRILGAAVLLV